MLRTRNEPNRKPLSGCTAGIPSVPVTLQPTAARPSFETAPPPFLLVTSAKGPCPPDTAAGMGPPAGVPPLGKGTRARTL